MSSPDYLADWNVVGHGIFMWDGPERRSNRYGSFYMCDETYDGTVRATIWLDMPTITSLRSKRVKVSCQIIESRKSGHLGDRMLNLRPSQPEIGDRIDLGVGTLDFAPSPQNGCSARIVLRPDDGREQLWINPKLLYRLHGQTVELSITETAEPFSPVPPYRMFKTSIGELMEGIELLVQFLLIPMSFCVIFTSIKAVLS